MRGASTGARSAAVVGRALALLAATLPNPVRAQQQPPADELTQAIVRYAFRFDGGNARLVPGRVPDDLAPNFHAPPGTRVLGTIVGGSSAVVLATTSTPGDSLRPEFARALEPRGWKPWEGGRDRGGFVPSDFGGPLVFCRGEATLHITHRRRSTPPHDLQLEYREGGGMCRERPMAERVEFVSMDRSMDRPRFPTLRSPDSPAARPTQSCYSRVAPRRGAASAATGTVVSTDLRPAELLQYYGRQLEAAGWTPPSRGASAAPVTGSWTRTDSTGAPQLVTLELTERPPGSGCYDVQMRLNR